MTYRNLIPVPPLSIFVESIWYYDDYKPTHSRDKLLPDGAVEIIFDLTEESKMLFDDVVGNTGTAFKRSWISGERTAYLIIQSAHAKMMGIRFRPGGAFPFLKFPVSELSNQVVNLDLVIGSHATRIREMLLCAPTIDGKLKVLENSLFELANNNLNPHNWIHQAINQLLISPQVWSIRDLADKMGFSQKHLISQFDKHVGLSPKVFSRVMKFQKVLQRIEMQKEIDWATVAYQCGYYDQAHFIKEFKVFSGINPSQYLTQRGEYLNYLPIE